MSELRYGSQRDLKAVSSREDFGRAGKDYKEMEAMFFRAIPE
jgi:hypothetical protein